MRSIAGKPSSLAPSDATDGASRHDWPVGAPTHWRILSDWRDGLLQIDGAPARGVHKIDLSAVPLPGNSDIGGPFGDGLTLGEFPHWVDLARCYAAGVLRDAAGHDPAGVVVNQLNHVFRFFAWCIRKRIYHLSAVQFRDMQALALDLQPHGWIGALSIHARLRELVCRARDEPKVLEQVTRVHRGVLAISPRGVSDAIGIPISAREYPREFREAMTELSGAKLRIQGSGAGDRRWSQASFKLCFGALNRLAHLPEGFDRLGFEPFANAREHARRTIGIPDQRTANLPIEEAIKLLRCALDWVYHRSDGVIELVAIWRDAICHGEHGYSNRVQAVNDRLQLAYPQIQERYGLPVGRVLAVQAMGACAISVLDMVQRLQTAALLLVGINQARRKNEIVGERRRAYGLYRGCLTLSDPFVEAYELDIYIEKTWQDWLRMSTNRLTVDAIRMLEKLRAAMFPDEKATGLATSSSGRDHKLFVLPSHQFFLGNSLKPDQYNFEKHSDSFYDQAGVAQPYRKTHQMRRMFALLYMYRWSHPSLQALSDHLCHLDLESTRIYVTDDEMRKEGERIEALYRIRVDGFPQDELDEARIQFQDDQLRAMLSSPDAGGPMTYRCRKWVRRLAHAVSFSEAELDALVGSARDLMQRHQCEPQPFRHGICWAGSSSNATRKGGCADATGLHRERAAIDVCGTCPFHSTSAAFLANLERDVMASTDAAAAAEDPREQMQYRASAQKLRELIDLEYALMVRHQPVVATTDKEMT